MLEKKLCGVFSHEVIHRREPLVRGCDDYFLIPHSRYTEVPAKAIHSCRDLKVLAESPEAGVLLCIAREGREVYIFGHGEYDRYTLAEEYDRDIKAGIDPELPVGYFPDDNPEKKPALQWRSTSSLLYSNWINYYVYQATPYDISTIR
jgi:homoserine O-succinyltransferase